MIDNLNDEIAAVLQRNMGYSLEQINRIMRGINEPFKAQIIEQIQSSRSNEVNTADFELSAAEIASIADKTLTETHKRLEEFSETKVSSRQANDKYEYSVDKIVKATIEAYKRQLGDGRERRTEQVCDYICHEIESLKKKLVNEHLEISDATNNIINTRLSGIQQQVMDAIGNVAIIVNEKGEKHIVTDSEELKKIDKIDSDLAKKFINSTTDEPGNVGGGDDDHSEPSDKSEDKYAGVDKAAKAFSDFASSLQSQTKTEEEISRSDAENLSDNQKAFKGDPVRDENAKKRLEDMFK